MTTHYLIAQGNPPPIPGMLCGLACGLFLGTLIGGVILRAACAWYNKMVGARSSGYARTSRSRLPREARDDSRWYEEPSEGIQEDVNDPDAEVGREYAEDVEVSSRLVGVPEPSMGLAMGIVVLYMILAGIVNFGIAFAIQGTVALVPGRRAPLVANLGAAVLTNGAALVVGTLIFTGLVSALLPTSFGKAFLVVLLDYLVTIIVALAVGFVVLVFYLAVWGFAR
jgi:hypothetical protein